MATAPSRFRRMTELWTATTAGTRNPADNGATRTGQSTYQLRGFFEARARDIGSPSGEGGDMGVTPQAVGTYQRSVGVLELTKADVSTGQAFTATADGMTVTNAAGTTYRILTVSSPVIVGQRRSVWRCEVG